MDIAGKRAFVAGGTRGIGAGIASAFARYGARVAVSSRSGTTARLPDGVAIGIDSDLARPEAPRESVRLAAESMGGIDILVYNAGLLAMTPLEEVTPEEWDSLFTVNLKSAFFTVQAALSVLSDGASVIFITSVAGQNGGALGSVAYPASKAGMIGLTKSLARHLAPRGIRVNAIAPADIETDMTADWSDELRDRLLSATPLKRFGTVDDVTGAALYLASDASSFVTGQILAVNGGMYMAG